MSIKMLCPDCFTCVDEGRLSSMIIKDIYNHCTRVKVYGHDGILWISVLGHRHLPFPHYTDGTSVDISLSNKLYEAYNKEYKNRWGDIGLVERSNNITNKEEY